MAFIGKIIDEMHKKTDEIHVKKGRNNKKSKKNRPSAALFS